MFVECFLLARLRRPQGVELSDPLNGLLVFRGSDALKPFAECQTVCSGFRGVSEEVELMFPTADSNTLAPSQNAWLGSNATPQGPYSLLHTAVHLFCTLLWSDASMRAGVECLASNKLYLTHGTFRTPSNFKAIRVLASRPATPQGRLEISQGEWVIPQGKLGARRQ